MKYNEQQIKQTFNKEPCLWHEQDLDWFDQELVNQLQYNNLPKQEKQKLIQMMANDQAVMNRYLELKQLSPPIKPSLFENIHRLFFKPQYIPILSGFFAIILIVSWVQKKPASPLIEPLRGLGELSIFPAPNSILEKEPDYFIVHNKNNQALSIVLKHNNKQIWISNYQQSSKYFFPAHLKGQLTQGEYTWQALNKDKTVSAENNFFIHK